MLYPTTAKKLNNCTKIYFSEKSILPKDQDPRWNHLMKKIGGKKNSCYYLFKIMRNFVTPKILKNIRNSA